MPFYQVFLLCLIPCLLFGMLAYFVEFAWRSSDAERKLDDLKRICDTRPYVRELPPLPWKERNW